MNEGDIRLDQTKRVFDTLATLISKNETCTYRYLIYDLLGFDGYYSALISGLTITNALVEKEDLQQKVEQLENKYDKALSLLSDFNMPCEFADNKIPDEYCEENCDTNDETYKKCWNKYIELNILNKGSKSNE